MRQHVMLINIIFLGIGIFSSTLKGFGFAKGIYYKDKISPYRILQKATSAFYNVNSVEVRTQTWLQSSMYHITMKFKNFIEDVDTWKVEGRVSFSSLFPQMGYSTSSWVQSYTVRGIPFSWDSQKRGWRKESLIIEDRGA